MKKRHKRGKKQHGFKKIKLSANVKKGILIIGLPILLLLLALISGNELFTAIAGCLFLTVPVAFAPCFLPEYFAYNDKKGVYWTFISLYTAIVWLKLLFSWQKITWLISLASFIACGVYFIIYTRETEIEKGISPSFGGLCWVEIIMFMFIVSSSFNITTETTAVGMIIVAVLAVAVSAALAYFIFWKKEFKLWAKIGYYVFLLFCVFMFCWSSADGLNWALDFSEPVEVSTRIKEKDSSNSSRGIDSYYFTAYIDGKIVEFQVSRDDYTKYNYNDHITVNVHKGALGMTYYTLKK